MTPAWSWYRMAKNNTGIEGWFFEPTPNISWQAESQSDMKLCHNPSDTHPNDRVKRFSGRRKREGERERGRDWEKGGERERAREMARERNRVGCESSPLINCYERGKCTKKKDELFMTL